MGSSGRRRFCAPCSARAIPPVTFTMQTDTPRCRNVAASSSSVMTERNTHGRCHDHRSPSPPMFGLRSSPRRPPAPSASAIARARSCSFASMPRSTRTPMPQAPPPISWRRANIARMRSPLPTRSPPGWPMPACLARSRCERRNAHSRVAYDLICPREATRAFAQGPSA